MLSFFFVYGFVVEALLVLSLINRIIVSVANFGITVAKDLNKQNTTVSYGPLKNNLMKIF